MTATILGPVVLGDDPALHVLGDGRAFRRSAHAMTPATMAGLLDRYARRALEVIFAAWLLRPPDADAVAVTFEQLAEKAAKGKGGQVRPAIDRLVSCALIERAGSEKSARGHPRNLYRVTPIGEAVAAAARRAMREAA